MFFTATIGIVIGGPSALYIVSKIQPQLLQAEVVMSSSILDENHKDLIKFESKNSVAQGDVITWNDTFKLNVDSLITTDFNETTGIHSSVVNLSMMSDSEGAFPVIGQGDTLANRNSEFWRGLSTVAGSWIGGGANQAALKEISETPKTQFSAMVIVDVFVANIWMAFYLLVRACLW